jgi:hypothetical protein
MLFIDFSKIEEILETIGYKDKDKLIKLKDIENENKNLHILDSKNRKYCNKCLECMNYKFFIIGEYVGKTCDFCLTEELEKKKLINILKWKK